MKNLTLFALLLLFSAAFTSCLPEVTLTLEEEPEEVNPVEEVTTSTNLSYGTESFHPNFAYLRTTPNETGDGFNHIVLFTQRGATIRGGDLVDYTMEGVIGVAFSSVEESPVGNFPVLTEGASAEATGVTAAGGQTVFSYVSSPWSLMNRTFTSGSMDIVRNESGDYKIEVDLLESGTNYSITGRFVGGVQEIVLPEVEEVSVEEFSGENLLKRDEEEITLRDAYLVEQELSRDNETYYRLFLTEEPVENVEGSLRGVTNAMMMKLIINDELKTGRYELGRNGTLNTAGFFTRAENDFSHGSYLCRGMDFTTNSMQDDEPMDAGEVVILVEGDQIKIKFNYESTRGASLSGEYHGSLMTLRR